MDINTCRFQLPAPLEAAVAAAGETWDRRDATRRLWAKDASLWTGGDEDRWLGWLTVAEEEAARAAELEAWAAGVRRGGFADVLLLGMGGSSLAPEVMRATFGRLAGAPDFHVLDSTDPAEVRSVERRLDLSRTLVIVASKSGTTLEPEILREYFFARMQAVAGTEAGQRFVAITDPGSALQRVAERDGFRRIFLGVPSIGGRYSALSPFGLVPGAVMGIDLGRWLATAIGMVGACRERSARANPGVLLGLVLGEAARMGRDKLTLVGSPALGALGAWLEQLVAESTGKNGKAIIPVDGEALGPPEVYGTDRVFAAFAMAGEPESGLTGALDRLAAAGHPVVRIEVGGPYALGQEFFRWEMATAVAGALLGVNPFDQPDVEASKMATRALTAAYESTGRLPEETPMLEAGGLKVFTGMGHEAAPGGSGGPQDAAAWLRAHLDRIGAGDYFALLAYVERNRRHEAVLQRIRHRVRDRHRVATCLGFGPRFLHSTGQAYKGGPPTGVFLQVTCDDAEDLPVPGRRFTFGVVKAAQARGDFAVLAERRRRAMRIHLGADVAAGLERLDDLVRAAIEG
jgi:transaldolase/glucose-6-phosphate isomerase